MQYMCPERGRGKKYVRIFSSRTPSFAVKKNSLIEYEAFCKAQPEKRLEGKDFKISISFKEFRELKVQLRKAFSQVELTKTN